MNLMKLNETKFTCYFIVVTIVVELYVAFHGYFGPKRPFCVLNFHF